jgi:hypothetical protein
VTCHEGGTLDLRLLGFWTLSVLRYSGQNTTSRKLCSFPSAGEKVKIHLLEEVHSREINLIIDD